MDDKVTVAVIAGTSRAERESIKAARYVADFARRYEGVGVLFADPRELTFPDEGNKLPNKDARYTDIVTRADAFCIITPEYNHSFPGSLKRMLDSEYDVYRRKPVAVAGVSNGPWGGVRVCEALLPVCHRLGLVNIQPELYFPEVQHIFDEAGVMKPEYVERYDTNTGIWLNELLWFARFLKTARSRLLR